MRKYRELAKNVVALILGSFGSKIIGFFLIPLYTSVLTTEEYGAFDLVWATVTLLIPILTLSIFEATTRFLLDDKSNNKDVLRISLKRASISIFVMIGLTILNAILGVIPVLRDYWYYFVAFYLLDLALEFTTGVARGMDRISNIAIGGFIGSVLTLILNLVFLLVFHWGLDGYFLAFIISMFIEACYLFITSGITKHLKRRKVDKNLEKEMLKYSKPIIFSSLGWWITNVSDRYIVTLLCGVAANGLYSVSYKIPSLLNVVHGVFNQAWLVSTSKVFDRNDEDGFVRNTYKSYNVLMVLGCSLLILTTKLFADVLYKNEFYDAWQYVPFLLIASVFGGISGVFGGVFTAVKQTKIMGWATMFGGVLNIILNFMLIGGITVDGMTIIPSLGIQGAAVATMITYVVIWALRLREAKRVMNLKINLARDCFSYVLLLIQAIVMVTLRTDDVLLHSIQLVILLLLMILYFNDAIQMCKVFVKTGKRIISKLRKKQKPQNV